MWKIIYIYWLYDKTHQTVHEGCKIFKCESCGKSFQVDFSEQTHRNYLFRSQRFQMWLLWKIIYSSKYSKMNNHIKMIHEGHKNFKCDSCGKFFLMLVIWKDTSKLFMKVAKISNVFLWKIIYLSWFCKRTH